MEDELTIEEQIKIIQRVIYKNDNYPEVLIKSALNPGPSFSKKDDE